MRKAIDLRRECPGRVNGRAGFTLIESLVVISLVMLLTALLIPAVEQARDSARRVECGERLRQINLATQSYLSTFGVFPSLSGTPLRPGAQRQFSVFPRLLPYLDQVALYDSINFDVGMQDTERYALPESSGGRANLTAMGVSLSVLLCPADGAPTGAEAGRGANARANFGDRFHMGDNGGEASGGPFSGMTLVGPAQVSDGLSRTAAYSEKLRGERGRARFDPRVDMLEYPLDGDRRFESTLADCAIRARRPGAFHTAVATNWLVGSLTQTLYNHREGPNPPEPDCLRPGFNLAVARASARGNHRGGVNVAMADGSVGFVSQSIDRSLWRALGTRARGN